MDYLWLFFDLDGTLTDSFEGITNAVVYALAKFGIRVEDKTVLRPFLGPPLVESFMKYFGFDHEGANRAVAFYREYYSTKGLFENRPYDGVPEMLARLKRAGKHLVVATSKPEKFSQEILAHFGLETFFDEIVGATMDEKRTQKSQVIACAIEKCGITDRTEVLMIGDRHYDVDGAAENGLDCMGVLYGYGNREELKDANFFAGSPEEVADLLLG